MQCIAAELAVVSVLRVFADDGHLRQISALSLAFCFNLEQTFRLLLIQHGQGRSLPTRHRAAPDKSVKITDLFKGKKGILFGVPGAFTPGCHKTHLKGYVSDYDKLTKAGAEIIVCVAVNDPFVMEAWGDASGAKGKVHMLADSHGNLARALGVELDMEKMLGTKRCKRFSAVIDNNVIKSFNVEPDGAGLTCSLSNEIVGQLQKT